LAKHRRSLQAFLRSWISSSSLRSNVLTP
jgi:hypothetical protein